MNAQLLQDLHHRAAIEQVRYQYAQALDRQDWDLLAGLLADEVAVDFASFGGPVQTVPRPALVDNFRHNLSRPGLVTQHLCTNFRITLAGDEATSVLHWVGQHFVPGLAGGEEFTLRAEYTDQLRYWNGSWRIVGMTAQRLFVTGNPGVLMS